ncbi:MAG: hypothetical protein H6705_01365 [Myxococcales bacterium]|nr:hypothetical protein [Myxococcales bacterium]
MTVFNDIPQSTDEILDAFDRLVAEREALAERIETRAEAAARAEDRAIAERAAGYSEEAIVNRLAALQLEFGAAVSGLAETVGAESGRLAELTRAIAVETERLAGLRQVVIAAEAVAIRAAERASRDRAFEADAAGERAELEDEVQVARAAQAAEAEAFAARIAEEDAARDKARRRAEADFDYETARSRKAADDAFAEKKRDLERALAEEGERREAAFAAREEALAERGADVEKLRGEVAGQPAKLKAKVDAAREEAIREAKAEAEVEAQLAEAEQQATLELQTLRIEALEATIARQVEELARLRAQLTEVLGRTQTLAAQAIGGSRA